MNKAIVDYYFVELNVEKHFEALRHFLLMEDGEFAQSLSDLLFEKVLNYIYLPKCKPVIGQKIAISLIMFPMMVKRKKTATLGTLHYRKLWHKEIFW